MVGGSPMKVGVLALQGAVREHLHMLEKAGAEAVPVKKVEQLSELDGIVLPGGESTTMRKLMDKYNFIEPLKQFAAKNKPVFGTCAGLILMANEIVGQDSAHLGFVHMKVERNAFGRQRESFETDLMMPGIADDFRAVFIRAPLIQEVGPEVTVLATYKDEIVAVREGQYLGAAFHPELTDDNRMHEYFLSMVKEYMNK